MKRVLLITVILLIAFLVSCNTTNKINGNVEISEEKSSELTEAFTTVEPSESTENNGYLETPETIEHNTVLNDMLPSKSIEIYSIEKLNEMRDMLSCNDEVQLGEYIKSVADCGIQNKDDLFSFVKLIDSLPQMSILEGNITWIRFSHSISEDTGKETDVVYVTTKSENGDWTRIEYVLSITDVSRKISEERELIGDNSVLNNTVKSADGNLTLYIETRKPHPSDEGTMILWIGEVKGIFTMIHYYTGNSSNVNTDNLFGNIQFE